MLVGIKTVPTTAHMANLPFVSSVFTFLANFCSLWPNTTNHSFSFFVSLLWYLLQFSTSITRHDAGSKHIFFCLLSELIVKELPEKRKPKRKIFLADNLHIIMLWMFLADTLHVIMLWIFSFRQNEQWVLHSAYKVACEYAFGLSARMYVAHASMAVSGGLYGGGRDQGLYYPNSARCAPSLQCGNRRPFYI